MAVVSNNKMMRSSLVMKVRLVASTQMRGLEAPRNRMMLLRCAATDSLSPHDEKKKPTTICPFCGATVQCCTYFCPECSKILSTSDKAACGSCTHFELLGLPPSFKIDVKEVEKRYKALQMELHPDKFANASKTEKDRSASESARLNEAFATLKSPMLRAKYLLEARGVTAFTEGAKMETDMAILTEAMELREELDAAAALGGDAADQKLHEFEKRITERIKAVEVELASALGDTQQLASAVTLAVRLRYLERIAEEVKEKIGSSSNSSSNV
jgi:molecular chaperone HscB